MAATEQHKARIKQDLKRVGVTTYGLLKSESRNLYKHVRQDEAIQACIYGQYESGSAMLVATDKRLLFIDQKPMHTLIEENTYERVLDVAVDWQPLYSSVVVSARPRSYAFKYVNTNSAKKFVRYIELRVLGVNGGGVTPAVKQPTTSDVAASMATSISAPTKRLNDDEAEFVLQHHQCVVSTIGQDEFPYGATMFYYADLANPSIIRMLTKSQTTTAQNIRHHSGVALTITDSTTLTTMNIAAVAELEQDVTAGLQVIKTMISNRGLVEKDMLPPVAQITNGAFEVFKLTITGCALKAYSGKA